MEKYLKLVLSTLLILISLSPALASDTISVAIVKDSYNALMDLLKEQNKKLQDIDTISVQSSGRVLADQIIMAKALKLGGVEPNFEYTLVSNSARERTEVKLGNVVISARTSGCLTSTIRFI